MGQWRIAGGGGRAVKNKAVRSNHGHGVASRGADGLGGSCNWQGIQSMTVFDTNGAGDSILMVVASGYYCSRLLRPATHIPRY